MIGGFEMKNLSILLMLMFFGLMACNLKEEPQTNEEYKLVWSDEFQYKGLPDSTKWSYDTEGNEWNWGNNEWQHYTAFNEKNAFVDGENLHIVAIKELTENKEYSSARLITKEKGDWLYGRFEIRAKLPAGLGTWPAIWMLPTDWAYGGWPASGEIDIMEHVGYEPDSVYASAHTKSYNHVQGTQKTKGLGISSENVFRTYVLEWDSLEYRVFVDSVHYFTFVNEQNTFAEWPFDKRFHLLLNVAVGGNWGGMHGVDSTIFPLEMLVDYVRVYQK
jgi:beta-glucanase (GH16 family)